MNHQAATENIKTLAATLGLTHDAAAQLLDRTAVITVSEQNATAAEFAGFLSKLLTRTISEVVINAETRRQTALEVIVGEGNPQTGAPPLWVEVNANQVRISTDKGDEGSIEKLPRIYCLLAACYAASRVLQQLIGPALPSPYSEPLIVDFKELFGDSFDPALPFNFGTAFLAGAGAIGNGFVLGLSLLNPIGDLHIADPDIISDGNLNRCVWFEESDRGKNKARRLAELAQPLFSQVHLHADQCRLQEIPHSKSNPAWLRRLIVAVDSRNARRALQSEIPGEVYDASTTDVREIVFHFNRQPLLDLACLSCVYAHVLDEFAHEQHVASVLGVTLDDLKEPYVSKTAAQRIAARYPQYEPSQLEGAAFDTLFKELCGEGQLKDVEDRVVLAPFSFISIMAGVYLAIEFARRITARNPVEPFNYWKISPWFNPLVDIRKIRKKKEGCEFCGNPILIKVASDIWGN